MKCEFKFYIVGLCILFSIFQMISSGIDVIVGSDNKAVEGRFLGYKNGIFSFEPSGSRKFSKDKMFVKSLKLDPPNRISIKLRGKEKMENVILLGYEDKEFIILNNGKEERYKESDVTIIDMGLDFRRMGFDSGIKEEAICEEEFSITNVLKKGKITVIHFHMPENVVSFKTGNFLNAIASQKSKLHITTVELKGWDDPVARKYEIISVPQLWFFDLEGNLVLKLIDKFTPVDIENAIKQVEEYIKKK